MQLTRQHFEFIAAVLRSVRLEHPYGDPVIHDAYRQRFADSLAKTNPRFDGDRFLEAATPRTTTPRLRSPTQSYSSLRRCGFSVIVQGDQPPRHPQDRTARLRLNKNTTPGHSRTPSDQHDRGDWGPVYRITETTTAPSNSGEPCSWWSCPVLLDTGF